MRHNERSDEDLAERAHRGDAGAFAVLFARHAGATARRVGGASDPRAALRSTWLTALRRLHREPAGEPFPDWIAAIADARAGDAAPAPGAPAPTPDELDALWRELSLRWPDGSRPRRPPAVLRGAAVVVVLVALAVLVPYLAMTSLRDPDPEDEPADLVARPFDEDATVGEAEPPRDPGEQDDDLDEGQPG